MNRKTHDRKPYAKVGDGRRDIDLTRRAGDNPGRAVILVGTNGKSTEKNYLTGLRSMARLNCRLVVVVEEGSPINLVIELEKRCRKADFDAVWAVCDVDEYAVEEADRKGEESRVPVLWANPCFELWLVLHFSNHTAHVDNADHAARLLLKHLPKFDKSRLRFSDFQDGVQTAASRAKVLSESGSKNPSSLLWRLIESIKAGSVQQES